MIALGAFRATFATLEAAREQVNRLFDLVSGALAKTLTAQDLATAFTEVPTGSVTVAISNAPAGSSATPRRYLRISDRKGGFYTFVSIT